MYKDKKVNEAESYEYDDDFEVEYDFEESDTDFEDESYDFEEDS